MKCENKFKYILIILMPIMFVFIMDKIYFAGLWIFTIAFIIFWFWGGKVFARTNCNKAKSFLIGNSLWLISFLLYLWQIASGAGGSKNFTIEWISQLYIEGMLYMAEIIVAMFTEIHTVDSYIISIVSYIFMFIIFSIGFIYEFLKENCSLQVES